MFFGRFPERSGRSAGASLAEGRRRVRITPPRRSFGRGGSIHPTKIWSVPLRSIPTSTRLLPFVAVLFVPLLLISCGAPPAAYEPPGAALDNLFVSATPVVVPGSRWQEHAEGRWLFRNHAELLVWVPTGGTDKPLVLRLRPARRSAENQFLLAWDGEALEPRAFGDGNHRLEISPERLSPGLHKLSLDREYALEPRRARDDHNNVFAEIGYRSGEEQGRLEPEDLPRYRLIGDFLQHGVVGEGKELRSGVLVQGPLPHVLEIERTTVATLHLEPRNFSSQSATFRVGEMERTVAAGEGATLAVDLAAGARRVELEIEGEADGLFLWGAPHLTQAADAGRTPIVLITLDTTRRDAIGPYNGRQGLTPNLDAFARQATLFENAHSTAPWTLPSHASIFTGLYPSKHGAGVSEVRLPRSIPTMAHLLRRAGYFTGGFSSGELSSSRFGVARGFHVFRDPELFESPGGFVAEKVEGFLDSYGDRPLFLFINYFDPHALYHAPEEHEKRLGVPALRDKIKDIPYWRELAAGDMSGWRGLVEGEGEALPEGIEYLWAVYLAEISYTDELLGRLFDQLKRDGIYDRALIVVTADHGELLGEGGWFSHGARLDPELIEIPLLIKEPGQREARRVSRLVSLVDLFPTVLGAVGVEAPPGDGRLLPVAGLAPGKEARPYVLFEEHGSLVHPLPERMKIAQHLFGVERPNARHLVWRGGQACAHRDGSLWMEIECSGPSETFLEAILAELDRGLEDETGEQAVPDELRESLEALGYM